MSTAIEKKEEKPVVGVASGCVCGLFSVVCLQYAHYPGGRCRRCSHGKRCHRRKR